MQNQSLQNQLAEVNTLINIVPTDGPVQLHWGRYLCVMVASFIENAVQVIYEDYAYSTAGGNVANYISNQIAFTVGNANADNITRTARAFSEVWATDLRAFMAVNDRRSAINTIVSQRNLIAHGEPSTISPAQLTAGLEKAVEVIDFIENQCLGLRPTAL